MYYSPTNWLLLTAFLISFAVLPGSMSADAHHRHHRLGKRSEASSNPIGHGYKRKVELIPADESLLRPEVSEDVELSLAHQGIGRHSIGSGRFRRGPVPPGEGNADNIVEFHERIIIKSEGHDGSQNESGTENETESGPDNTEKLLDELKGLRENIEKEIARLKEPPSSRNMANKETNILVRASRELVRRAELDSRGDDQNIAEAEILMPYRACIYIDVPGQHAKDEGEPLIPENLQITRKHTSLQIEAKDEIEDMEDKTPTNKDESQQKIVQSIVKELKKPAPPHPQMENQRRAQSQSSVRQSLKRPPPPPPPKESGDADVEDVLWLHMPPNDPLDAEGMRSKLYDTVDTLHHEGKDVLFIPIAKNYENPDDVKHGFLKSLQVKPERYKNFKNLRVKRF